MVRALAFIPCLERREEDRKGGEDQRKGTEQPVQISSHRIQELNEEY